MLWLFCGLLMPGKPLAQFRLDVCNDYSYSIWMNDIFDC